MRIILGLLIMVLATQFTRAFPFLIFSKKEPPKWLLNGAKFVPGAVMLTLVLTSLPMDVKDGDNYLKWIAASSVITLHLIFKHPLVSIFGGTGIYMLLLHFL